jgi:hypothetical protein
MNTRNKLFSTVVGITFKSIIFTTDLMTNEITSFIISSCGNSNLTNKSRRERNYEFTSEWYIGESENVNCNFSIMIFNQQITNNDVVYFLLKQILIAI